MILRSSFQDLGEVVMPAWKGRQCRMHVLTRVRR